jgi:exonuclease SbcC
MFGLAQFEEQNLQKKIPLAGFSTIKELDDAFLDHQIAQKIEAEVAQKRESLAQTQSLLANSQQNLANLQQQNTTNYSIEELSQMFAEQKKQLQEHSEQIGKLMQQKSNHEAQLEKATALNQKINAQRLIYARWDTIKKVVGAADGKDFRATAQAITLDHLVLLANQHIKQLSDRYIIQKNNSGLKDKELELEIIDLHQADITRPMKSLSGGESFLISLALALGLSDLASKNRPINTLFIDEGFGSLSPDALEMAINTFENLQEQGKIIGIISHVDALKERIPVQIQVSKKGNSGTSEINIVFK